MFRLALRFIWAWGAGGGGAPPPVVTEGPFWVASHHVRPHAVYPMYVQPHHVQPGKAWSTDRSLETFRLVDEA